MLERISEHDVGIKRGSELKYRILAEVQRKGHCIEFDVLYYAKSIRYWDIVEEIGQKEGEYIRELKPVLNTQIPKANNWRSYTINKLADFFQVTVTSVKIRLLELGYNYLKGIHDYVDNAPTKPYLYNAKEIKANQIFSAGLYDVVASEVVNSDLKTCLQAKTIVYASGFFVIWECELCRKMYSPHQSMT